MVRGLVLSKRVKEEVYCKLPGTEALVNCIVLSSIVRNHNKIERDLKTASKLYSCLVTLSIFATSFVVKHQVPAQ